MGILKLIAGIFKPAAELIDNLHTSTEEKLLIKQAIQESQLNAALQFMTYEKKLLEGQTAIVVAEAQGGSTLQRIWRPITMLTFLVLVVADSFGWLPFRLAEQAWTLLQIGLGGYVVGRSVEKSMPHLKGMLEKNDG
jgi:hypothetical protein